MRNSSGRKKNEWNGTRWSLGNSVISCPSAVVTREEILQNYAITSLYSNPPSRSHLANHRSDQRARGPADDSATSLTLSKRSYLFTAKDIFPSTASNESSPSRESHSRSAFVRSSPGDRSFFSSRDSSSRFIIFIRFINIFFSFSDNTVNCQ